MTKENNLVENYTQNFHQYSLPILQVNTEISVVVWKLNKKSRKIDVLLLSCLPGYYQFFYEYLIQKERKFSYSVVSNSL